jgi:hypothetical protein
MSCPVATKFAPGVAPLAEPAWYTYWSALEVGLVALEPVLGSGAATVTSTTPGEPAGAVAVIWVSLLTVYVAAAEPKFTAVAPVNPLPEIVTELPPSAGPAAGFTPVTTGWAAAAAGTASASAATRTRILTRMLEAMLHVPAVLRPMLVTLCSPAAVL